MQRAAGSRTARASSGDLPQNDARAVLEPAARCIHWRPKLFHLPLAAAFSEPLVSLGSLCFSVEPDDLGGCCCRIVCFHREARSGDQEKAGTTCQAAILTAVSHSF